MLLLTSLDAFACGAAAGTGLSRAQLAGGDWHAGRGVTRNAVGRAVVAAPLAIGPELGALSRRTLLPSSAHWIDAARVPGRELERLTVPVRLPIVRIESWYCWHWHWHSGIKRRGERWSMDERAVWSTGVVVVMSMGTGAVTP